MATLFVVMRGEAYEGAHCEGVYSNEQLAQTKVANTVNDSEDYSPWEESRYNSWTHGCEYVTIESWPVEGPFTETVWLVLLGEAYEGMAIRDICGTEELARTKVVSLFDQSGVQSNKPWTELRHNSWKRGCDVLAVEEWTMNKIYYIIYFSFVVFFEKMIKYQWT